MDTQLAAHTTCVGFTHLAAWTPCAHLAITWWYTASWLASQPTAADHVLSGCNLIGQSTNCSWPCAQWLPICCMLFAPTWNTIWICISTLELFCVLTSVQPLTNIFCHLLVYIFWYLLTFSGIFWWVLTCHMVYWILYQISLQDLWQFAAFMNLPYVDATSGSVPNLVFLSYMDPKDILVTSYNVV